MGWQPPAEQGGVVFVAAGGMPEALSMICALGVSEKKI